MLKLNYCFKVLLLLRCSNTTKFEPLFTFRWPAMGIHGDKSQQERDWVLNGKFIKPLIKLRFRIKSAHHG